MSNKNQKNSSKRSPLVRALALVLSIVVSGSTLTLLLILLMDLFAK
jgi:multisubunit Na+/H+ antiporter MnhC subunit